MATATQILANANYRAKAYDVISTSVKKGKRDEYNAAAKELEISLAQLIQNGVEEYIINHAGKEFLPSTPTDRLSAEDKRLIENLALLPKTTRAKFIGLVEDFADQFKKGGD